MRWVRSTLAADSPFHAFMTFGQVKFYVIRNAEAPSESRDCINDAHASYRSVEFTSLFTGYHTIVSDIETISQTHARCSSDLKSFKHFAFLLSTPLRSVTVPGTCIRLLCLKSYASSTLHCPSRDNK